jgi:hypothetical protein
LISKDELLELADHVIDRLQKPSQQPAVLALANPDHDPGEALRLKSVIHSIRSAYRQDWSDGVEFGPAWDDIWSKFESEDWEKYFLSMDLLKTRVVNMQNRLRELLYMAQDGVEVEEIISRLDRAPPAMMESNLDGFDEKFLVKLGLMDGISPEHRKEVHGVEISNQLDSLQRAWHNLERFQGLLREEFTNFLTALDYADEVGVDTGYIRTRLAFPKTAEGIAYDGISEMGGKSRAHVLLEDVILAAVTPGMAIGTEQIRRVETVLGTLVPNVSRLKLGTKSLRWKATHFDVDAIGEGDTPEEAVQDFRDKLRTCQ